MIRLRQGLDPTSSRTLLCASIMSGISGVSCWRQQPRLGEVITAITAALLSLSFLLLSLSPSLFFLFIPKKKKIKHTESICCLSIISVPQLLTFSSICSVSLVPTFSKENQKHPKISF